MDGSSDDYFASLGGSLMKDLLADLQVDEGDTGWLSLEQLEKELAHIEEPPGLSGTGGPPPGLSLQGGGGNGGGGPPGFASAASMVVSHAAQTQVGAGPPGLGPPVAASQQQDAWKTSLEKFTALSLDQDFLAADTVRKQQKQHHQPLFGGQAEPPIIASTTTTTDPFSADVLASAELYDVGEKLTLPPPPGLGAGMKSSSEARSPPGMAPPPASTAPPGMAMAPPSASTGPPGLPIGPPGIPAAAAKPQAGAPPPGMITSSSAPVVEEAKKVDEPPPPTPQNSIIVTPANEPTVTTSTGDAVALNALLSLVKEEQEGGKADKDKKNQQQNKQLQRMPPPPTPQNSVRQMDIDATVDLPSGSVVPPPTIMELEAGIPTQQDVKLPIAPEQQPQPQPQAASAAIPAGQEQQEQEKRAPETQEKVPKPAAPQPHQMPHPPMPHPQPPLPQHGIPAATGMVVPPGVPPPAQGPPGPHHPGMPMQAQPPQIVQQPQPVIPPVPVRIYCNPLPTARPIPAAALESDYMKARDISYVIHSIMKPVLAAGSSPTDYHIQFFQRQSGPAGGSPNGGPGGPDGINKEASDKPQAEMQSRAQRSKEWSSENAILGHVAKTNVARPRALIATPLTANKDENSEQHEQRQRASLWKARIYNDQAYQSYMAVVEIWRSAPPGTKVPPEVQPHLIKLMKCLGISRVAAQQPSEEEQKVEVDSSTEYYRADTSVLQLFLKLNKGRRLLSRLLDQALLPPRAVQVLLPAAMKALLVTKAGILGPSSSSNAAGMPPTPDNVVNIETDDRLFRSWTRVIQTLPNISGDAILQSVKVVQNHSKTALSSTVRMECVHSLLQRGTAMAANPAASGVTPEYVHNWKQTETEFMNLLAGGI